MSLAEELAWLGFYLPRQAVQLLARPLPLAALRDAAARRRRAAALRAATRRASPTPRRSTARAYAPWGEPATLDAARPVRYDARAARVDPRRHLRQPGADAAVPGVDPARRRHAAVRGDRRRQRVVRRHAAWLRSGGPAASCRCGGRERAQRRVRGRQQPGGRARARRRARVPEQRLRGRRPAGSKRLVGHLDRDRASACSGRSPTRAATARRSSGRATPTSTACSRSPKATRARTPASSRTWRCSRSSAPRCTRALRRRRRARRALRARPVRGRRSGAGGARRGWRVALARDVFVHHYGGASFSRLPAGDYLRLWWQNRRTFERKWGVTWQPRGRRRRVRDRPSRAVEVGHGAILLIRGWIRRADGGLRGFVVEVDGDERQRSTRTAQLRRFDLPVVILAHRRPPARPCRIAAAPASGAPPLAHQWRRIDRPSPRTTDRGRDADRHLPRQLQPRAEHSGTPARALPRRRRRDCTCIIHDDGSTPEHGRYEEPPHGDSALSVFRAEHNRGSTATSRRPSRSSRRRHPTSRSPIRTTLVRDKLAEPIERARVEPARAARYSDMRSSTATAACARNDVLGRRGGTTTAISTRCCSPTR